MFAHLREGLSDPIFIFTDGSKLNNSAAFSITTDNSILRIAKLDEYGSSFSCGMCVDLNTPDFLWISSRMS